jgi:hypothetical protein
MLGKRPPATDIWKLRNIHECQCMVTCEVRAASVLSDFGYRYPKNTHVSMKEISADAAAEAQGLERGFGEFVRESLANNRRYATWFRRTFDISLLRSIASNKASCQHRFRAIRHGMRVIYYSFELRL